MFAVADPGEGLVGPAPPLSQGLDDPPPPTLSEGLDLPLVWDFKMWPLAVLTGDRINGIFLNGNVWMFC